MRGLEFRKFKEINLVLLLKHAWRMAREEHFLWTCILSAIYLKGQTFFEYTMKKGVAQVWRGIVGAMTLIRKVACYKLGNGCSINPWTNPWIPRLPYEIPKEKLGSWVLGIRKVLDLKDSVHNW